MAEKVTEKELKEKIIKRVASDLRKKDPKIEQYFRNNMGKFDRRLNMLVEVMGRRPEGEYEGSFHIFERQIVNNYRKSLEEGGSEA